MNVRLPGVLAVLLLAAVFVSTFDPARAADFSAREIVDKAVLRSETQLEINAESAFHSLVRTLIDSFDGEGKVKKTERSLYSRYPLFGAVYDELIQKDGRPLTEEETRDERKRKDKFIEEVQERVAEGNTPQPENERQVRFDSDFMSRYRTRLTGEQIVRNHSCWVIFFEPREGKLPVNRRMDEALNRSTGKLWISQDDFGLVRVEFEMKEPIRYLAGLLATVRNTAGRLEFERIEDDVWLPVDFELSLDLRILFKNIRRNIRMSWRDYRRADSSQISGISNGTTLSE